MITIEKIKKKDNWLCWNCSAENCHPLYQLTIKMDGGFYNSETFLCQECLEKLAKTIRGTINFNAGEKLRNCLNCKYWDSQNFNFCNKEKKVNLTECVPCSLWESC